MFSAGLKQLILGYFVLTAPLIFRLGLAAEFDSDSTQSRSDIPSLEIPDAPRFIAALHEVDEIFQDRGAFGIARSGTPRKSFRPLPQVNSLFQQINYEIPPGPTMLEEGSVPAISDERPLPLVDPSLPLIPTPCEPLFNGVVNQSKLLP